MTRLDDFCIHPWFLRELPERCVLHLEVDRESFDAVKELLRTHSSTTANLDESAGGRMKREALKRVFDQIRDVQYDSPPRQSLDHE